ncbi:MAG: hypothetical protein J3K34DRAFT_403362 [Monoraphidium minutum]|nr:MAG: hypothetical protein J3K34DRAFT_403362 [Monoraphidium minutum]
MAPCIIAWKVLSMCHARVASARERVWGAGLGGKRLAWRRARNAGCARKLTRGRNGMRGCDWVHVWQGLRWPGPAAIVAAWRGRSASAAPAAFGG